MVNLIRVAPLDRGFGEEPHGRGELVEGALEMGQRDRKLRHRARAARPFAELARGSLQPGGGRGDLAERDERVGEHAAILARGSRVHHGLEAS